MGKVLAIILAGGTGTRLGANIPKQYIEVQGKMIISYVLDVFEKMKEIDAIWVVANGDWREAIAGCAGQKLKGFSAPGANRQLSIWNGLQDIGELASAGDVVIIHDAARPLVSEQLLRNCIEACKEHDGALPVLPMKDTVYLGEDGKISALLDRSKVFAGQAPEAFLYGKYWKANEALIPEKIMGINGSTEPAIMAGMDVALVEGEEINFKITTAADLERFKNILENS